MAKCKDCTGDDFAEIKNCTVKRCALHPHRLSKQLQNKMADDEAKAAGKEGREKSNRGVKELSAEHKAKMVAARQAAKEAKKGQVKESRFSKVVDTLLED